jgi:hypothetical protein
MALITADFAYWRLRKQEYTAEDRGPSAAWRRELRPGPGRGSRAECRGRSSIGHKLHNKGLRAWRARPH